MTHHHRDLHQILCIGLCLCALLCGRRARAQDIHFTQMDVNPILYNPAYSGFFDGKGRFGVAYRNQWASVTNPFQTVAVTAEYGVLRRRYQRDGISIGAIVYADREGTLNYGVASASAILSYMKAINDANMFSVGMEVGYGRLGFDVAGARFFEEGEQIDLLNVSFPLVGMGMAWYGQFGDDFYLKMGVAGRNLNRPNISYMYLSDTYLERRYNIYSRAEYRYWSSVSLLPFIAFQWQKNFSEYIFGADVKWYVSESTRQYVAFSAGLYYRWRDAVNLTFTLDYNEFLFAFCYDANLSKLTTASHSIGAFELQMVYRLGAAKKTKYKALPCPII